MGASLLPINAKPFEMAFAKTMDVIDVLGQPALDMRGLKLTNPPDSFLPFLHYEYGLGPVTQLLSDPRQVIELGVPWARVRGTHEAVALALAWTGYQADIEVMPVRRRMWNRLMLAMAEFRTQEEPDLDRIEYATQISLPLRSKFWRGFYQHDVRALEFGRNKWGREFLGSYSGARIRPDGAKWSYGREYESIKTLTEQQGRTLGVWIPEGGAPLTWGPFTWNAANAAWASSTGATRKQLMINGLLNRPVWIRFYDGTSAIGYRRARVVRGVVPNPAGPYTVGGNNYMPEAESPTALYLEFMTDFGDGFDHTAVAWELIWDALPADTSKPGLPWVTPAQIAGAPRGWVDGWTHNFNNFDYWTLINTTAFQGVGYVGLTATGSDPQVFTPTGLNIEGGQYDQVTVRMRRTAGTVGSWDGSLYYETSGGHGISGSYYKRVSEPAVPVGTWFDVYFDMRSLDAGGSDWVNSTISRMRFDFGLGAGDNFEIDYAAVFRVDSYVSQSQNIEFGRTVRERFRVLLNF
jgi:hypothetical protein